MNVSEMKRNLVLCCKIDKHIKRLRKQARKEDMKKLAALNIKNNEEAEAILTDFESRSKLNFDRSLEELGMDERDFYM